MPADFISAETSSDIFGFIGILASARFAYRTLVLLRILVRRTHALLGLY